MKSNFICSFGLAAVASALSLPPLIPTIPGVTEPLSSDTPPLPILQVPTPPLDSPPFTPSNIRPKKIGFFWTASGDNQHKDECHAALEVFHADLGLLDFLATYSLDDDTFGKLIYVTDVPSSGNSPHHLGPSLDGKTLIGGGLLSLLKTQDTAYYFDVSNPYRPAFSKSNRAILSSITDEIRAKPDGGFFITYMGSAVGTSPGRLVETDSKFNIIHEWPEDPQGVLNVLGEQFSPHGLSIDWEKNIILTSDFVVPVTILKPTLGKQSANTLRLWNLASRTIISTLTIPNVSLSPGSHLMLYGILTGFFREVAFKMSSSFQATKSPPLSPRLSISDKSGLYTPSVQIRMASRVLLNCCTTWAIKLATPSPSTLILLKMANLPTLP